MTIFYQRIPAALSAQNVRSDGAEAPDDREITAKEFLEIRSSYFALVGLFVEPHALALYEHPCEVQQMHLQN
jgi:hypothetical protein